MTTSPALLTPALLTIGEMARASALPISALRFYDKEGVLVPHSVDPHTGYRWYTDDQLRDARLIAGMRRVGVPVREMTAVLTGPDPHSRLDAHLRNLEDGLADARAELDRIHRLIDSQPTATGVTLDSWDVRRALDAVLFAVDADSEFPILRGVHIDIHDGVAAFVTTDRYRLAVAEVSVRSNLTVSAIVPLAFARRMRDIAGVVTLTFATRSVTASYPGGSVSSPLIEDGEFPDHRILREDRGATELRGDQLAALLNGATETAVVSVDGNGSALIDPADVVPAERFRVLVDRQRLREAAAAQPGRALVIRASGAALPLAIRTTDYAGYFSYLMPLQAAHT
ncbi:DNA polymerase III subunit beta family protein [Rhodococcus globerulus]|uniref:MerR family DNA-binding transcriptional regulator n=1 Tax=Rhodococcus globerulus TaxID=33008 RepID=A0ABU4BW65_RHOGO|nr:MerR family DNA-binding transcriptional regulator [Rhodococcus globerulus]MDV6268238.1 MerR family DNA-binding transcriptional regulator [Rhodococcus globerulus]